MTVKSNTVSHLSARSKARKRAVEIVYEADLRNLSIQMVVSNRLELLNTNKIDITLPDYAKKLLDLVADNLEELKQLIQSKLINWDISRIPAIERAILLVAGAELIYLPEVSASIIIDEALKIAKLFASVKALGYLNGVLANIAATLPASGVS